MKTKLEVILDQKSTLLMTRRHLVGTVQLPPRERPSFLTAAGAWQPPRQAVIVSSVLVHEAGKEAQPTMGFEIELMQQRSISEIKALGIREEGEGWEWKGLGLIDFDEIDSLIPALADLSESLVRWQGCPEDNASASFAVRGGMKFYVASRDGRAAGHANIGDAYAWLLPSSFTALKDLLERGRAELSSGT